MSENANKKDEALKNEKAEAEKAEAENSESEKPEAEGPEEEQSGGESCCEDEKQSSDKTDEKDSKDEEEALNLKYMRLMADFQNFKRRTEKEKSDIYAFANEKIISELLNVIDNFERALAAGKADDSFYKGMEMILKQLLGVLEKAGASEIDALGKDFDPNFHNAVMTEDSTEYESGKVTEVLQKGYILNNKVIRPSMVKVAN